MEKTFYTPELAETIRQSARRLGMQADPRFWNASAETLAQVCNGYGPDMWSDSLRGTATWFYRNFPEAAMIHDWDFKFSDGKDETLILVNKRFSDNNSIKLAALYPMSKPLLYPVRAVAWGKIHLAYRALQLGSDEAWASAHARYAKEDCAYCRRQDKGLCLVHTRRCADMGWCVDFKSVFGVEAK